MIHNIRHMPHVIPIGIQTETGVEAIGFDVKPWLDEYDGLTITVWPTRPGEGAAYPAADVKLVGTVLYWTPNATDTAIQGVGRVEILGVADGKRKLSGYCDTLVKGTSLDATQETPEPIKPWVDQVVAAGAQALTAVDKMPKISADGTWMVWDSVLKVYADTGLPSSGDTRVYVGSDEPPEDAEVWIDPEGAVSGSDLPAATATEPGAVVLDASLTKAGAAADAKAVGDKVAELSEEIAKLPTGGGAIIDVTELPTDGINEDVFYRLLTGTFYFHRTPQADWTCYVVDSLPQEGEPVTTDMVHVLLYYAVDTGSVSGYISSALSGMVGVPAGWYPVEALAQAFGLAWGGIIWDESEGPNDDANRLVLKYSVFYFKQEWINLSDKVGWRSPNGAGAEVFNSLRNTASGETSHAEGTNTTASGSASHAEGYYTTASGSDSHAEGTHTTASGSASHAEGTHTTASGDNSHAEGYYTTASGSDSHVQGRLNIDDTSNKYAHIVGNGTHSPGNPDKLSNAYTLDWDGNAWFAGGIELTSPNGTRYRFTVSDDGTLTATAV